MVKYTLIHDSASWNRVLLEQPNTSPLQVFELSQMKAETGWRNLHLAACKGQQTGYLHLAVRERFGILFCWCVGAIAGDASLFDRTSLLRYLRQWSGRRLILVRTNFTEPLRGSDSMTLYQGGWQKVNRRIFSEYSIMLDLRPDSHWWEQNLSGNWRKNLRRGLQRNLGIECRPLTEMDPQELGGVFRDFAEVKEQLDLPDTETIVRTQRHLGSRIHVAIARQEGSVLGLRAFLHFGIKGLDYWAATGKAGRDQYTSFALLWRCLEQARTFGIEQYDMAGIDPVRNPTVFNFKNGLRGDIFERLGEWQISSHPLLPWVFDRLFTLRV